MDPGGKKVGLYSCGPTVHNFAHIGNFRTFVFADLLRRHLEFKGFEVTHVMNITDVEDKIIKAVRETGLSLKEFTGRYEAEFLNDLKLLGCKLPTLLPRATEFIPQIIAMIQRLMDRGIAYQSPDGSAYFSIENYRKLGHRYGQLLKLNFDEQRPGGRVSSDEYGKESVADFALWKARVPEDGEVFWPSPWGEGRPGWHIECSAMSTELLGPSFDLHVGGEDLIFPHHEDEIAQSEGSCGHGHGAPFVRYWMHGAHLLVEGKKMAKSLGNFFTIRDLVGKGFSGREIRFLLLSAHYRESFNFTLDGLQGARSALARIDELLLKLAELAGSDPEPADEGFLAGFTKALDEDLNVAAAWGHVFEWVRGLNKLLADGALAPKEAAAALRAWSRANSVLGVADTTSADAPPEEVIQLVEARQAARKSKAFARADEIRDQLKALGWSVEDTAKGPRARRI